MSNGDEHFLPGVSFEVDGESVPARELCWAMYANCGCVCAMHMMTVDTIGEDNAWKAMSGNAAMVKRDKDRGFSLKMIRRKGVPFDDCPHSPKWGYMPPPTPDGHTWATTFRSNARSLHLVPLTPLDDEQQKDKGSEWAEHPEDWRTKATSMCGRVTEPVSFWTHKWYRTDGKVECASCLKAVEAQVLL